jgi:cytochrome b561
VKLPMRVSLAAEAPKLVTGERYTRTAMVLHWVIAALILVNVPIGLVCHLIERDFEQALMNLHKPIGITVIGLSLARFGWRLLHRAPRLPLGMPMRDRVLAQLVHWSLYALMIGVPISGWWTTSAFPERHPTVWFGLEVPFLPVPVSLENAFRAHDAHSWLSIMLTVLAVAHIAAALRHRWRRDGLFERMWPVYRRAL